MTERGPRAFTFKSLLWVLKEMLALLRNGVRHLVRGNENFVDKLAVAENQ